MPRESRRWVPAALIVLSFVPVAAGTARVAQLTGGAKTMPEEPRFAAMPVPVLLHIVCASLFCVLGAFQFATGFRRRRPGWHRVAGRLLVLFGLTAALTGLWMTMCLPRRAGDADLLAAFRLAAGSIMALSIVLGFTAIRRRDFARHRMWMIRAYAVGQGAGTQAVFLASWMLIIGPPGELSRAVLHGAAWAVNLAVAERIIRRSPLSQPKQLVTEVR
jgi:uncharacterized membrane protein YozB (DUF420 family)